MRASEVIFRTLAKERHRSAADNLSKSKADPASSNRRSLECEGSEKEGRNARWGTSRASRASKLGSKESHHPRKITEQKKPDDSATFRRENIEKPRSHTHTHKISELGSTVEQTFSSECQIGNVPSCSVVTKAASTGCTPNKGHSLNDKAPVEKEGQNGGFSKALN